MSVLLKSGCRIKDFNYIGAVIKKLPYILVCRTVCQVPSAKLEYCVNFEIIRLSNVYIFLQVCRYVPLTMPCEFTTKCVGLS